MVVLLLSGRGSRMLGGGLRGGGGWVIGGMGRSGSEQRSRSRLDQMLEIETISIDGQVLREFVVSFGS